MNKIKQLEAQIKKMQELKDFIESYEIKTVTTDSEKIRRFDKLTEYCLHHLDEVKKGENIEDDDHYFYEDLMTTCLGSDIFKYKNALLQIRDMENDE